MSASARSAVLAIVASLVVWPSSIHAQLPPRDRTPDPALKPPEVVTVDNAALDRLEQWLGAIAAHDPGAFDEGFDLVQSWTAAELQTLWIHATAMLTLTRQPAWKKILVTAGRLWQGTKPEALEFTITIEGKRPRRIKYSLSQTQRLKVMACAADGEMFCPEILSTGALPAALGRLADRARAARRNGDDNFVLKHGALLHADIAIAAREMVGPLERSASADRSTLPAPDQLVIDLFDGAAVGSREVAIHWTIARMLLDAVVPRGERKPAPGKDSFVRDWYRATAAWMQHVEDHDTQHLDRARELFHADADVLFLSGCQREIFAAPRIQSGVQSAAVPAGFTIDIAPNDQELRRAEEFLRRAVAARPDDAEMRLHFGHVLLRRGNYREAAVHLRQVRLALEDPLLRYYGALMLGAAEEQLTRFDAAHDAYEAAASLQRTAQAPLMALSALARRRGDRPGALRELQRVFALPADATQRDDPWWSYYTSHVRDADTLIDGLRRALQSGA